MPSGTTIINAALDDLGVIRPGETVSATILNDCLLRLNRRMSAHSVEQLMAQNQVNGQFALTAGVSRYTLGSGGTFNAGARAERVSAWRSSFGIYATGGAPLLFSEFDAAAQAAVTAFLATNAGISAMEAKLAADVQTALSPFMQGAAFTFPSPTLATAQVPLILAADANYPLLNIEVFPVPATAATLELSYWTALTQFADLTTVYTFPDAWEDFLHFDLAMSMTRYQRAGFDLAPLAAAAQNAKAKIADLNRSLQQQAAQK